MFYNIIQTVIADIWKIKLQLFQLHTISLLNWWFLSWFFIGVINCAPTLLLFPPSPVTFLLIPLSPRTFSTCNCSNIGIKHWKYKFNFNNKSIAIAVESADVQVGGLRHSLIASTTLQPSWLIPSIRRKFLPVFTREVSVSMTSWVVAVCC